MSDPVIRPMRQDDLPALAAVLTETGLFPPDMLDGMAQPWFADPSAAVWLVAQDGAGVCGLAHARPEALTDGTWNLLALAVRPAAQGRGIAAALVSQGEAAMRDRGARLVIVDTAGTADYATARRLYARLGYAQVARIPDYWAEGVDKITFAKRL